MVEVDLPVQIYTVRTAPNSFV